MQMQMQIFMIHRALECISLVSIAFPKSGCAKSKQFRLHEDVCRKTWEIGKEKVVEMLARSLSRSPDE